MSTRLPSNLGATGLVLDAEHVADAGEIIRRTKNERALALLGAWRCALERTPFAVVAGELHRTKGGIYGGLAPDWQTATLLFRSATMRLDEIAAARGNDFSSAWILFLTEARQREIQALAAGSQSTQGQA